VASSPPLGWRAGGSLLCPRELRPHARLGADKHAHESPPPTDAQRGPLGHMPSNGISAQRRLATWRSSPRHLSVGRRSCGCLCLLLNRSEGTAPANPSLPEAAPGRHRSFVRTCYCIGCDCLGEKLLEVKPFLNTQRVRTSPYQCSPYRYSKKST
jgi:hypothetical protein